MSAFEHLLTLGSFVLAISLAQILRFCAAAFHRRKEVRLSPAHALWVAIIFLAQISFWLGAYNFQAEARMTYEAIAFVVVQPVLFFLQSALVSAGGDKGFDLKAHHAADGRAYMGLHLVSTGLETAFLAWAVRRVPALDVGEYFLYQGVCIALIAAAILFPRSRIQVPVALALLVFQFSNLYFGSQALAGVAD